MMPCSVSWQVQKTDTYSSLETLIEMKTHLMVHFTSTVYTRYSVERVRSEGLFVSCSLPKHTAIESSC